MIVLAKQVDPEIQESPLFDDDKYVFAETIAIFGNPNFETRIPETVNKVLEVLEEGECAELLCDEAARKTFYKNRTEVLEYFLPKENGKKYSTVEVNRLIKLFDEYSQSFGQSRYVDICCKILTTMTGYLWDSRTIRGSCQSDWNIVVYRADLWSLESLDNLEIEYFNEGTVWLIDATSFFDASIDDVDSGKIDVEDSVCECVYYSTRRDEEEIKREIARDFGVDPSEVLLFAFDGYTKTPKYRRVS